jgi:hypothetical protein
MHCKIKRLGLSENAHPSNVITTLLAHQLSEDSEHNVLKVHLRFLNKLTLAHQHKHKTTAEKLS